MAHLWRVWWRLWHIDGESGGDYGTLMEGLVEIMAHIDGGSGGDYFPRYLEI